MPLLILLSPLIGAIVIALFGPYVHRAGSAFIGNLAVFYSFVLSVVLAAFVWHAPAGQQAGHVFFSWARTPPLTITFGLQVDRLSLLWMLIITGVGFLIHLYSVGYMAETKNYRTFFAYMNFFVFSMLLLVMSDNFLWLLVGWAGVGLASYLLIGFDYDRPAAVLAARKALIMNVIGDVGIMIAMFLMYAHVHSVSFGNVFANVSSIGAPAATWIGIWLFVGAVAKSAQLPLHTWLPDAMEGPTPVSALIHAATMVTAGVYLVARAAPIYDGAPAAAQIVAVTGALTALFAATIGCVLYDIKRVLAYSTISQIGYMITSVGIGAYAAGSYHFMTHAFFKALLFMAAGIVIHNLSGEQDVRKMGGLWRRMPLAAWTFAIGTAAIAGIPPLAGFWSKDAILDAALRAQHPALGATLVATALLTAFYMFRVFFLTFFSGEFRGEHEPHAASSPTMAIPTIILAGLSVVGGFFGLGFAGEFNAGLAGGVLALVAAGIALAFVVYERQPAWREAVRQRLAGARGLLFNAYYIDGAYHVLFEVPTYALATAFARYFDPQTIGGLPRGLASGATWVGDAVRNWETGYLRRYGLTIVVGVVAVLAFYWYVFVVHAAAVVGVR